MYGSWIVGLTVLSTGCCDWCPLMSKGCYKFPNAAHFPVQSPSSETLPTRAFFFFLPKSWNNGVSCLLGWFPPEEAWNSQSWSCELQVFFFLRVGFKLICSKVQGSKLWLKNNTGNNTSLLCALKYGQVWTLIIGVGSDAFHVSNCQWWTSTKPVTGCMLASSAGSSVGLDLCHMQAAKHASVHLVRGPRLMTQENVGTCLLLLHYWFKESLASS